MGRFRPRTSFRLAASLQRGHPGPIPAWKREEEGLSQELHDRWSTLHRHCADQSSHLRLGRLVRRLTHHDYGVRESALAELELAIQLLRVGVRVTFLPESKARTADFECGLGRERFFVEVTAMVGSAARQRLPLRGLDLDEVVGEEEDRGVILIHRILARIRQKAKQLADYCDPVMLSISIPRADLQGEKNARSEAIWVDLKALAGVVTVLLTRVPTLSAVLISLWDVEPLLSRGALRLANVEIIERPKQQRAQPRVQMLIRNPSASAPLSEYHDASIRQIL
ncbi:hypothetical protein [Candidatus Nitrospira nitrificans]|uniref:Uncharacterized protein n=1 Tax=Candidatus Nitrospira nitrificans TaxID=1742973 RepID=A0A0S4LTF6_9BACT|nr:hypothetical protein [Candidatus Nitrospira nitrificans]CUS39930.1 hypothetical protein COMA2_90109 [Candidatus Nitrospira nitrificans]